MSITLYDSIENNLPADAQAIAGYVGGNWPTATYDWFKNHRAPHKLTIAINAQERARCLDIESGDATPGQAPGWFNQLADRSQGKPVLYGSASAVGTIINAMNAAGISRDKYLIWSAHYTNEHICGGGTCGYPQADGTQYNDRALGQNLDVSIVSDGFFGPPAPPPPPPDPHHYQWFGNELVDVVILGRKQQFQERAIVQEYDTNRVHPWLHLPSLKWHREVLGVMANRVYSVAHEYPDKDGKPSWDVNYRGWRYQQLKARAGGQRLV